MKAHPVPAFLKHFRSSKRVSTFLAAFIVGTILTVTAYMKSQEPAQQPVVTTAETDVTLSSGDLVITDNNGGPTNDTLTLSRNGTNVRVSDPNNTLSAGAGNNDVVITAGAPSLAVSKSNPSLTVGQNSTYTITVTNNGGVAATMATVKEAIPAGLDLVSTAGANWSCVPSSGSADVGTITCTFSGGSIAASGGTSTFNITVKPIASFCASSVTNKFSVDPTGGTSAPDPTTCTALNTPAGCGAPVTSTVTNPPPTLGTYPSASVIAGGNTTVTPNSVPSDNSSIMSITATAAGAMQSPFTGSFAVNPTTGVVTITDAKPAGTFTVTVTAMDNCEASASKTFTLTVNNPITCLPADFGFRQPTGSPIGVGVNQDFVAVGDFNGDGKQDLAVASTASNNSGKVNILLGSGGGGFSPATGSPIDVGSTPYSLVVGDFNGDGQQDLAVANLGDANVTILLGNDSGGFSQSAGSPVGVGSAPRFVVVGDFNGDGKQDLAVANQASDSVTILLGNGSGGFSPATGSPIGVGTQPFSVAVGDFNGDGKQDLAVANVVSNDVTILLGNGSGGFSPTADSPIGVGTSPRSVAVGDFNSDGKQDLAVANGTTSNVTILLGNGSGGFSPAIGSPVGTGDGWSMAAGDFNGDGKQDLAVANVVSNNVTILLGNGSGGFSPAAGSPIGAGTQPFSVVVGDFNGDGKQDLAMANYTDPGTVTILLNNCAPSFSIDDVTHNEGDVGTTSYTFTVTKTGATALSSSVNFTTQDGNATLADNDYQTNSGTLNFGPTDTTMQITVLVNGDTNFETNEAFTVHLSGAVNATISDADGTGTITNDDGPSISGHVAYDDSVTTFGKNVTMTLTGNNGFVTRTTTTDANGDYFFANVPTGNDYTLTPSKVGDVGALHIESIDAAKVARFVAGLDVPTPNQKIAADADGDGLLTSFDAALIARYVAGLPNSGIVGTWKFVPVNRTYPNFAANQTAQNFTAILVGDTDGNWQPAIPSDGRKQKAGKTRSSRGFSRNSADQKDKQPQINTDTHGSLPLLIVQIRVRLWLSVASYPSDPR